MSDDEYAALKADIAAHGVREPMTMHDGMILDGRNRYRACQELGIQPPPPRTLGNGQSPTAFVVSANLHRRHLSQSQKACVANNVEKYLAKEAKQRQRKHGGTAPGRKKTVPARLPEVISNGEAREQAAAIVGVSPRYVSDAKAVEKADPKLYAKVAAGEVSLPRAKKQLTPPPPVPISKTFGDALSDIRQRISGIRDQYGDGEKMLASPLWRKCDTDYAIEMTGMLGELLTTLHKEMLRYVRKTKKGK